MSSTIYSYRGPPSVTQRLVGNEACSWYSSLAHRSISVYRRADTELLVGVYTFRATIAPPPLCSAASEQMTPTNPTVVDIAPVLYYRAGLRAMTSDLHVSQCLYTLSADRSTYNKLPRCYMVYDLLPRTVEWLREMNKASGNN